MYNPQYNRGYNRPIPHYQLHPSYQQQAQHRTLMDDDGYHSPRTYEGFMPEHNTRRREIGMQAQQGGQGQPVYRHPWAEQYPSPPNTLRLNSMYDERRPPQEPRDRANPGQRRQPAPGEMHQGQQQQGSEDGGEYDLYQENANNAMMYY